MSTDLSEEVPGTKICVDIAILLGYPHSSIQDSAPYCEKCKNALYKASGGNCRKFRYKEKGEQ